MAVSLWKVYLSNVSSKLAPNLGTCIRNGHHMRGKPPGEARTLKQRLEELNYKDPDLHFKVDIGLPPCSASKSMQLKKKLEVTKANRKNLQLEKQARDETLEIDLKKTRNEWFKTTGQFHIKAAVEHYGVYEHLFGDAYFFPRVPLNVTFDHKEVLVPVHYGNIIKPAEAANAPAISFESDSNSLWTLILTNPDGHFTKQDGEYVHWFIGNIPGNDVSKGETIVQYLQPFPAKGTGYQRHVFILYKQNKKLDYSPLKREGTCLNLAERTFCTLDFYRDRQDLLTPAGLVFFQSDWDSTLKDFYHNKLDMKEPIFEYDFPEPYVRPQEWFPLKKAFNLYMDRYRDPKQINKEFLVRKLKNVHPFKEPTPPLLYPNAQYFKGYSPEWLKTEMKKSRLKEGRINEIE